MSSTTVNGNDEAFQSTFFQHIEQNTPLYISRLAEAVAIKSVSCDLPSYLPEINKMMDWTEAWITRLGGTSSLLPNPNATKEKPLPPILLGEFRASVDAERKKTLWYVCVCGAVLVDCCCSKQC
mmetsp:Transcript_33117/g.48599  ORF Transcript_33117/g.48599 Transcript_33117/m.48599 type:complete len:124 (+) Transcript_33117:127-498(+)